MIDKLSEQGVGIYPCGRGKGWIQITLEKGSWVSFWTSHETYHNGYGGSAYSVEYKSDGSIGWVFKSAITMWPVRDKEERQKWIEKMGEKIQAAMSYKQPLSFWSWLMKVWYGKSN